MEASAPPRERIARHRAAQRGRGLRPVVLWLPDVNDPDYRARLADECRRLARMTQEEGALAAGFAELIGRSGAAGRFDPEFERPDEPRAWTSTDYPNLRLGIALIWFARAARPLGVTWHSQTIRTPHPAILSASAVSRSRVMFLDNLGSQ